PLYAGSTGVCLAIKFTTAPNGTADFVTGAIDLSASLSAAAYVSLITTASTKICPRCNGAGVGLAGTCDSGARVGQACTVDDVVTVPDQPGGSQDYNVSRDCQPSGSPFGSIALSLTMTTGAAMVGNGPTCAGQTSADNCSGTCSAGCAAGANNGGVSQLCCSDNTSRACFPDPIIRNGVAAAPAPGGTTFPKSGDETLVSAFCAPSTSNVALDSNVGVPGPVALIIPGSGDWLLTPTSPSTRTTTTAVWTTSTRGTGPT